MRGRLKINDQELPHCLYKCQQNDLFYFLKFFQAFTLPLASFNRLKKGGKYFILSS